MRTKVIILGCGSSSGVPRIDGFWGNCDKNNKKNFRTRCSIVVIKGNNSILIDTSPDLKQQFLSNNIKNISYVLYTHEHGDQTHGINDLRPFFWKNKKKINIYGNKKTIKYLRKAFFYCFKSQPFYPATLKSNIFKNNLLLGKKNEKIKFRSINVQHGNIYSLGYIFENTAYISDCSHLSKSHLSKMKNLKFLIIDCLKYKEHPTHLNLNQVLSIIDEIKPKKTILTNLHHDLDYNLLLNILPRNVQPAYDGLKLFL